MKATNTQKSEEKSAKEGDAKNPLSAKDSTKESSVESAKDTKEGSAAKENDTKTSKEDSLSKDKETQAQAKSELWTLDPEDEEILESGEGEKSSRKLGGVAAVSAVTVIGGGGTVGVLARKGKAKRFKH